MTLVLAVPISLLGAGQLGTGPLPVPGGLGRGHPVPDHHHHDYHHHHYHHHSPVVSDHLLAVPPGPLPHLGGLGLPASHLEHDVGLQAVRGGAAGEIAGPHHRVETGGWGPKHFQMNLNDDFNHLNLMIQRLDVPGLSEDV